MSTSLMDATWVLFVGRSTAKTEPAVEAFFATLPPETVESWRIESTPAGCAIASADLGREADHDMALAARLSSDGEVGLWWPASETLLEFAGGQERKSARRHLVDWLDDHGVQPSAVPPAMTDEAAVFLGLDPAAVEAQCPPGGPMTISPGPAGAILKHAGGQACLAARALAQAIGPNVEVVCVIRAPDIPFLVEVIRAGDTVGYFGESAPQIAGIPVLTDVVGEQDPDRILQKLGLK